MGHVSRRELEQPQHSKLTRNLLPALSSLFQTVGRGKVRPGPGGGRRLRDQPDEPDAEPASQRWVSSGAGRLAVPL